MTEISLCPNVMVSGTYHQNGFLKDLEGKRAGCEYLEFNEGIFWTFQQFDHFKTKNWDKVATLSQKETSNEIQKNVPTLFSIMIR